MNNHDITAIILAGGQGTRLRSVVSDRQKVVAEVNGKPFLTLLLRQLEKADIRRIIVCTGYMAETVKDALAEFSGRLELHFSHETEPLGTGGAVKKSLPLVSTDYMAVLNGDSFLDLDIRAFRDKFFLAGRKAQIALNRVGEVSRYGQVRLDHDGLVMAFEEKGGSYGPGIINAGIYLFAKDEVVRILPEGKSSMERDLLPELVRRKTLFGELYDCTFIDIGLPETLQAAQHLLANY